VARLGDKRNACRVVLKVKDRSALEGRFLRRKYNIKMNLKDNGWETVNWNNPAYVKGKCAVMNTVMYCCVREISWLAEDTVSFREDFVPCIWFCEQFPALRGRPHLSQFLPLRDNVLVMSMESCLFLVPACGPSFR